MSGEVTSQQRALNLLASIDNSLKRLVTIAERRASGGGSANGRGPAVPAVASDADLDSQHGDEVIKGKDPRDWSGESMKGRRMSECPADYLDLLAERFDFFAQKNDENGEKDNSGRPKSTYDKRSAARARGWAARIRAGWKPKTSPPIDDTAGGDLDETSDFDNGKDPFAGTDDF